MENNGNKNKKKKIDKRESLLVTKESICSSCGLFSFLAFLILCTRSFIFGDLGLAMHSFFMGVFGYLAYPAVLGALYVCAMGLIGKRLIRNRRFFTAVLLTGISAMLIVHSAVTFGWAREGYLSACFYSGETFPKTAPTGWLGGLIVFSVSAVMSNVGAIVTFSAFTAFCLYLCVIYFPKSGQKSAKAKKSLKKEPAGQAPADEIFGEQDAAFAQQPVVSQRPEVRLWENGTQNGESAYREGFSPFGTPQEMNAPQTTPTRNYEDSRAFLFSGTPEENYKKNLIFDPNSSVNKRPTTDLETAQSAYTPSYSSAYEDEVNQGTENDRPTMIVDDRTEESYLTETEPFMSEPEEIVAEPAPTPLAKPSYQEPVSYLSYEEKPVEPMQRIENDMPERGAEPSFGFGRSEEATEPPKEEYRRHDYMDLFSPSNPNLFGGSDEDTGRETLRNDEDVFGRNGCSPFGDNRSNEGLDADREDGRGRGDALSIFDEPEDESYTLSSEPDLSRGMGRGVPEKKEEPLSNGRGLSDRGAGMGFGRGLAASEPAKAEPLSIEPQKPAEPPKPRVIRPYKRIPLDDFDCRDIEPTANADEVEETKQNIIATLEDFKVTGASIASVTFGPTVTRYNVTLPRSISPRKVVALDQSIAISLHSSGVNIYPNYEDGVVSIEVPNKERQFVQLGCMLSGDTFVNAKSSSLMFTMGKDVANAKVYGDISKMIHLLVAGSSGSGKSVFLGALIVSMIYKYSPEELRLILIDPKKTEFVLYNNLPHLMINEIITDVNKTIQSLNWAIGEMNRRYGLFEQMSRAGTYVVNLDQYNAQLEKSKRLPKIVIIIDELADLMLAAKKEIEDRIQNLTQKARAAGIHLIVATQRPSTDVITGVIKSNLPTRVAFYVATDVDSRVILDQTGAQKLLGKGDFLYTMPGKSSPGRVQSAFISPEDSQRVVNYIKANNEAYYDEEVAAYINNTRTSGDDSSPTDKADLDPMYIEALRYVILSGSASISMIQRKCSAGYNRAGKIIEWMEDMGYISAFDGAKARKVLITKEDFESIYGPLQ